MLPLPVYPGHPLTLAYHVVQVFPTMEKAFAPTDAWYKAALASCKVPGAGSNVRHALDLLQSLRDGTPFKDVVEHADLMWSRGDSTQKELGIEQAREIAPLLEACADWWKFPDDGAVLSCDEKYRYRLWRRVREGTGMRTVAFVMINPSTADAATNDRTIRKCIKFARAWEFDRFEVVNLFAIRTKEIEEVEKMVKDGKVWEALDGCSTGLDVWNPLYVAEVLALSETVVCAWGKKPWAAPQAEKMLELIRQTHQPMCIARNGDGSPAHPLFLKSDLRLQPL